ncbi:MAG: hypothetical protein ABIJ18_05855 [archaeon]
MTKSKILAANPRNNMDCIVELEDQSTIEGRVVSFTPARVELEVYQVRGPSGESLGRDLGYRTIQEREMSGFYLL